MVPRRLGDLGPSNKITLKFDGAGDFQADSPGGKNLHFGIREHAMAATVNGLALSKLRAFCATFFIFGDYARPAIRLAALMELPAISSSRTTRWATARMARPTSRWSS